MVQVVKVREIVIVGIKFVVRIKLLKIVLVFRASVLKWNFSETLYCKISSTLANLFCAKKIDVYENIYCQAIVDLKTKYKRANIIVIDRKKY